MELLTRAEVQAEDFDAVDVFAGPGGWEVAARKLGLRVLGVELDDAACETRVAAGLETLKGDVAALSPRDLFPRGVRGVIGSPPCQAFSSAGKGEGRRALPALIDAIDRMLNGETIEDLKDELDAACGDARAHLVLEPLRWIMELEPEWVALEQVREVLPLWEAMAAALRVLGYSVWTGVLMAEQYGVPQTRKRAVLLASKEIEVDAPTPAHQRYVAPRRKGRQEESLFEAPETTRLVASGDEGLKPWVSMAEALGWAEGDYVGFPRRADTEDVVAINGVAYRGRDLREASEPAFALTEKARSWTRWHITDTGNTRGGTRAEGRTRRDDEPAMTITGRADQLERRMDGEAVRVTLEEAAALQSFPRGYPWHGTKTKQFEQVGNAIPPPLAGAALRAVVRRKPERAAA